MVDDLCRSRIVLQILMQIRLEAKKPHRDSCALRYYNVLIRLVTQTLPFQKPFLFFFVRSTNFLVAWPKGFFCLFV